MTLPTAYDPATEYQRRLGERQAALAKLNRLNDWIATARGLTFLGAVGYCLLWYFNSPLPFWPLGVLLLAFVSLIVAHGPVSDRLDRARNAVEYYKRALDRLADRWSGHGTTGQRYANGSHLYADDLDLFGRGSLFELLCQAARTRLGEDALAGWLGQPTDQSTICRRQEAVEELRHNIDLREQIALLNAEVHDDLDQNRLVDWSREPARPVRPLIRVGALLLATLSVAALIAASTTDIGIAPFLLTIIVDGIVTLSYGRTIRRMGADRRGGRFRSGHPRAGA